MQYCPVIIGIFLLLFGNGSSEASPLGTEAPWKDAPILVVPGIHNKPDSWYRWLTALRIIPTMNSAHSSDLHIAMLSNNMLHDGSIDKQNFHTFPQDIRANAPSHALFLSEGVEGRGYLWHFAVELCNARAVSAVRRALCALHDYCSDGQKILIVGDCNGAAKILAMLANADENNALPYEAWVGGVVTNSVYADLRQVAYSVHPFLRYIAGGARIARLGLRLMFWGYNRAESLHPIQHVKNIPATIPIMLVHSKSDWLVNATQAYLLYYSLLSNEARCIYDAHGNFVGSNVYLVLLEDGDHTVLLDPRKYPCAAEDSSRAIRAFCVYHAVHGDNFDYKAAYKMSREEAEIFLKNGMFQPDPQAVKNILDQGASSPEPFLSRESRLVTGIFHVGTALWCARRWGLI